jgi:hypothetical protein
VASLLEEEIEQGARFVNIYRHINNKKEHLLVTTAATRAIDSGMFHLKVRWCVPHSTVERVYAQRGVIRGYTSDVLVIDGQGGTREFTFGFNDRRSKELSKIAEANATVAANEINKVIQAYGRAPTESPEFAEFKRAIALAESGPTPDTEPSDHWLEEDYMRLWRWMMEAWDEDKYQAIWTRRVALGSSLGQRTASQQEWFWVNALPALAGLQLGQKEHPSLAMFAGHASQAVDPANEYQRQALSQIEEQFFG